MFQIYRYLDIQSVYSCVEGKWGYLGYLNIQISLGKFYKGILQKIGYGMEEPTCNRTSGGGTMTLKL